MTWPHRVKNLAGVAIVLGLAAVTVKLAWPAPRLNLLLITLDTTRADRLGCYGYEPALTPALDQLAEQGVLFERAYAAVPLTLPSHATLFTGLYPPEHGLHYNGQNSLGLQIPTLAEVLRDQGYQTGAFIGALVLRGKFGLGRGFQAYDEDCRDSDQVHGHLDRMRRGELVVNAALGWLRRQVAQQPFFCWVHLYDPHHPYLSHEELFGDRFHEPYDGEIAYVDRQIARLVDDLQQRGLAKNTLIIIAGDHGESLGEHGEATHSYMLYESTMRVPLIINSSRLIKTPGRRVSTPVSLADVHPTILAAMGIQLPQPVSGQSLLPALRGQEQQERLCYGETDQPFGEFGFAPQRSVTSSRWKYIRTPEAELYDLLEDPHELHNLATRQPDDVEHWDGELAALEQRMSRRTAPAAQLTGDERKALESLGYAGGAAQPADADRFSQLPDIKRMIGAVTDYNTALAFMAEDKYPAAERLLHAIIETTPDLYIVHHNLGVCLTAQSRDAEALPCFRRALEIKDDPQTQVELAKIYLLLDRPQEAIPHLEVARRLKPDSPKPPFYWGEALRQLGDRQQARERYREAIRLQPQFAPARAALRHLEGGGK